MNNGAALAPVKDSTGRCDMSAAEKIESLPVAPGKWVRPNLLMPLFGITPEQARKYRERGIWIEETHWRFDPVGRVVYNRAAIDDWFGGVQ